jgi:hypothetical protein
MQMPIMTAKAPQFMLIVLIGTLFTSSNSITYALPTPQKFSEEMAIGPQRLAADVSLSYELYNLIGS